MMNCIWPILLLSCCGRTGGGKCCQNRCEHTCKDHCAHGCEHTCKDHCGRPDTIQPRNGRDCGCEGGVMPLPIYAPQTECECEKHSECCEKHDNCCEDRRGDCCECEKKCEHRHGCDC